jgi:DNA repair exonuclease SbcCD nuclease subunit
MPNPSRPVRFVHTSDVHLGSDHGPDDAVRALTAVVDATRDNDADLLLIPGDVFDHNRVSDDTVRTLLTEMERLEIPAVILPGNHDCLLPESVYNRPIFDEKPSNLHIMRDLPEAWLHLPELDVEFWGRPVVNHEPTFYPLGDVPEQRGNGWRIVMAHGHVEDRKYAGFRSSPIFPDHIEETSAHYVAMGHWDRQYDASQGNTPCHYSGCPQGLFLRNRFGSALIVNLVPGKDADIRPLELTPYGRFESQALSQTGA